MPLRPGEEEDRRRQFDIGDRVEARYKQGSKWYPAKVVSRLDGERYELAFDDGDEDLLHARYIKPAKRSLRLSQIEEKLMNKCDASLISLEARAALRSWARSETAALSRLADERRPCRLEECLEAIKENGLPRDLKRDAERLLECLAAASEKAVCVWAQFVDFVSYPPETTSGLVEVRRNLGKKLVAQLRRKESSDAVAIAADELREACGFSSSKTVSVSACVDALLENKGRPHFACGSSSSSKSREGPLISRREAEDVCEQFADDDRRIDPDSLVRWLCGGVSFENDEGILKRGQRKLAFGLSAIEKRDDSEKPMRDVFRRLFDRDGEGSCNAVDFRNGICAAFSLPIVPAEIDALIEEHELRDGRVDYEAALKCKVGRRPRRSSEDSDEDEKKMRKRSLWNRTFGSGAASRRERSDSLDDRRSDRSEDDDDDDVPSPPALVSRRCINELVLAIKQRRNGTTLASVFKEATDGATEISFRELRDCLFGRSKSDCLGALDVPEDDQENLMLALFDEDPTDAKNRRKVRVAWADIADFLEELVRTESGLKKDNLVGRAYTTLAEDKKIKRSLRLLQSALEDGDRKHVGRARIDDFRAAFKRHMPTLSSAERDAIARHFGSLNIPTASSSRLALGIGGGQNTQIRYSAFIRWLTADANAAERKLARCMKLLGRLDRRKLDRSLNAFPSSRSKAASALIRFSRRARFPLSEGEIRAICRLKHLDKDRLEQFVEEGQTAVENDEKNSDVEDSEGESKFRLVPTRTKRLLLDWVDQSPVEARKVLDRAAARGKGKRGTIRARALKVMLEDEGLTDPRDDGEWVELLGDDDVSIDDFLAFVRTSQDETPPEKQLEALEAVQRRLMEKGIDRATFARSMRKRRHDDGIASIFDGLRIKLSSSERRALKEDFGDDLESATTRLCVNVERAKSTAFRCVRAAAKRAKEDDEDIFESIVGRTKNISLIELREALVRRLGFPLSDGDVCALFGACRPEDGCIRGRDLRGVLKDSPRKRVRDESDDEEEDESCGDESDWEPRENDPESALVSAEFRIALRSWARKAGGLRAIFEKYDVNGDGELSARELRKMMKRALDVEHVEGNDLDTLITCLDADGDGRIDLAELVSFARSPETKRLMGLRSKLRRQLIKRQRIKPASWLLKNASKSGVRSAIDVAAALSAMDDLDEGVIPETEFKSALGRPPLNFELRLGEASALAKYFSAQEAESTSRMVEYVSFARWLGSDAAGHTAWEYAARGKRLSGKALRRRLRLRDKATDTDVRSASASTALRRAERKLGIALELLEERSGGKSLEKIRQLFFAKLDRDDDGRVNRFELRKALVRMGIPFGVDEVNALLDKFDTDGDGRISYKEFKKLFARVSKKPSARSSRANGARGDDESAGVSVAGVAKRVRRAIRGGDSGDWPAEVASAFNDMDRDKNGSVNGDELATWLCDRLRVKLSAAERAALLDCLDVDGDGTISYDEFVDFVLEDPVGDEVGIIAGRIRDALGVKGCMKLRAALQQVDQSGSKGLVDEHDVWRAVEQATERELDLTAEDRAELARRFADKGGQLRYLSLCAWLEAGLGDAALRRLRLKIKRLEHRRGGQRVDARQVFRHALSSGGALTRKDIGKACDQCGIYLSAPALDALVRRFDANGDGRVDWGEFRKALFHEDPSSPSRSHISTGTKASGKNADDEIATSLEAIFSAFDANGDGRMSRKELRIAAPHVLRAFRLQPSDTEVESFCDALRLAAGDSKTIDYAIFEETSLRHVTEALETNKTIPADLRRRLEDYDVRGNGSISRDDFRAVVCNGVYVLSMVEANALEVVCAAYTLPPPTREVDDEESCDGENSEPTVEIEEIMRLVRAAAEGGLDAARAEAQAAPWRRNFDSSAIDRDVDSTQIAAEAALRLARGAAPDPASYLHTFLPGLLPKSFREPALAAFEREPSHSLTSAIAPERPVVANSNGKKESTKTSASLSTTRLAILLCEARAVPAPAKEDTKDVARFVRCSFASNKREGSVKPVGNVHVARAVVDPAWPDRWIFESPHHLMGNIIGPSKPSLYVRDIERRVALGLDSSEFALVADQGKDHLSLLLELTIRIPKAYFEGASTAKPSKQREKGEDSEEDDDDEPSDFGISDSDDENSEEEGKLRKSRNGKRKSRNRRRRTRRHHSDSESRDDESSDRDSDDDKNRLWKRPIWHRRKLFSSNNIGSARRSAEDKKRPEPNSPQNAPDNTYVEVSCGWALIPLARLRERDGPLSFELKGGSPLAEDSIERGDIPRHPRGLHRQLARLATGGYKSKSRLRIRVKSLTTDHPLGKVDVKSRLERAAIVPEPFAALASTYATYFENRVSFKQQLDSSNSAALADPVLSVCRDIFTVESTRVALRAIWSYRFDQLWYEQHSLNSQFKVMTATSNKKALTRSEAELAALKKAVLELWPFCDTRILRDARDEAARSDLQRLSRAQISSQALDVVRSLLEIKEEKFTSRSAFDGPLSPEARVRSKKNPQKHAPFHTRELVVM